MSAVDDLLDSDQEAGLRSSIHDDMLPNGLALGIEQLNFMSIAPMVSCDLPHSLSSVQTNWQENELPTSRVKMTWSFSMPLHQAKTLGGRKSYDFAGISNDCKHAYLCRGNRVSVFSLANLRPQCTSSASLQVLDLCKDFKKNNSIFKVVMSESYILVVTCQYVRVISIYNNYDLEASPHGE